MAKIVAPRMGWLDEGGMFQYDVAVLQCDCGNQLDLIDPLDNTCFVCGRNYNMGGQLVLHSRDPRVEEPYWED